MTKCKSKSPAHFCWLGATTSSRSQVSPVLLDRIVTPFPQLLYNNHLIHHMLIDLIRLKCPPSRYTYTACIFHKLTWGPECHSFSDGRIGSLKVSWLHQTCSYWSLLIFSPPCLTTLHNGFMSVHTDLKLTDTFMLTFWAAERLGLPALPQLLIPL